MYSDRFIPDRKKTFEDGISSYNLLSTYRRKREVSPEEDDPRFCSVEHTISLENKIKSRDVMGRTLFGTGDITKNAIFDFSISSGKKADKNGDPNAKRCDAHGISRLKAIYDVYAYGPRGDDYYRVLDLPGIPSSVTMLNLSWSTENNVLVSCRLREQHPELYMINEDSKEYFDVLKYVDKKEIGVNERCINSVRFNNKCPSIFGLGDSRGNVQLIRIVNSGFEQIYRIGTSVNVPRTEPMDFASPHSFIFGSKSTYFADMREHNTHLIATGHRRLGDAKSIRVSPDATKIAISRDHDGIFVYDHRNMMVPLNGDCGFDHDMTSVKAMEWMDNGEYIVSGHGPKEVDGGILPHEKRTISIWNSSNNLIRCEENNIGNGMIMNLFRDREEDTIICVDMYKICVLDSSLRSIKVNKKVEEDDEVILNSEMNSSKTDMIILNNKEMMCYRKIKNDSKTPRKKHGLDRGTCFNLSSGEAEKNTIR